MVATEKRRRVPRVKGERLKSGERMEDCGGPLPPIADELRDTEGAITSRRACDRYRIPSPKIEVATAPIRRIIAPGIPPLFSSRCPIGGAVKLRLTREHFSHPVRIGLRL